MISGAAQEVPPPPAEQTARDYHQRLYTEVETAALNNIQSRAYRVINARAVHCACICFEKKQAERLVPAGNNEVQVLAPLHIPEELQRKIFQYLKASEPTRPANPEASGVTSKAQDAAKAALGFSITYFDTDINRFQQRTVNLSPTKITKSLAAQNPFDRRIKYEFEYTVDPLTGLQLNLASDLIASHNARKTDGRDEIEETEKGVSLTFAVANDGAKVYGTRQFHNLMRVKGRVGTSIFRRDLRDRAAGGAAANSTRNDPHQRRPYRFDFDDLDFDRDPHFHRDEDEDSTASEDGDQDAEEKYVPPSDTRVAIRIAGNASGIFAYSNEFYYDLDDFRKAIDQHDHDSAATFRVTSVTISFDVSQHEPSRHYENATRAAKLLGLSVEDTVPVQEMEDDELEAAIINDPQLGGLLRLMGEAGGGPGPAAAADQNRNGDGGAQQGQ
ncbi:unnamed protein product [Amoebophrya sp. A120]|nr:unnamed protein product [Amoebophrya sp. A120]|eukprot:GSA120T00018238001.1